MQIYLAFLTISIPGCSKNHFIKQLTQSDNINERRDAALKLGRRSDESAVGALIAIVEDNTENVELRRDSLRALVSIAQKRESTRSAVVQALLVVIKNCKDSIAKRIAIDAFTIMPSRSAVPLLVEVLEKDKNPGVRLSAVNALVAIGDKSAAPALIKKLKNEDNAQVRKWIVTAFDFIPPRLAVPAFSDVLMNDKSNDVKKRAAISLGLIGDRSAIPALIAGLDDLDVWVRYRCLLSLIKLVPQSPKLGKVSSPRYDLRGIQTSYSEVDVERLDDVIEEWKMWWEEHK